MTVFADSSAVVQRYADEPGHRAVRALPFLVVSSLARVEVPAAIWRKSRTGDLNVASARTLVTAFEDDWHDAEGPYVAVAPTDAVLERAADLTATHGLRGYDAVVLASALMAREADPSVGTFACGDRQLSDAAAREGLLPLGG